jgi:hypothetical protein
MAVETAEPPSTETPTLPNPVLPSDMELSKQTFRDAMAAEKPVTPEVQETVKAPEAPKEVVPTEPETKAETKEETKVEIPPASKAKLPEELITGKKPEAKVDDAIAEIDAMVLPKNAKPEQVASFAKLKEQSKKVIEEKLARINELETKTSDGSTRAEIEAAQERVKTAETKAKELESTIERIAFTESPRFKQFIADESSTLASAKSYFEGTEINPEIVEYAARTNGAQRIKILREAGLDAELIAAVQPYLAQYDNIQRHKAGALENWKTESAQMAEHHKSQQEAELNRRREGEDKVWTTSISKFENDLVPYRKFDANDAWNSRSDELKSRAKSIYNGEGISLDVVADTIVKGVAYDALDEVRVTLTDELNKLIQENAKLKASRPNGGSVEGTPGTPAKNEGELSPAERSDLAKSRFNQELAKARGQ